MTNINSHMSGVYTKMKAGGSSVAKDSKVVLADLVVYASTIIIALAWNEFFVALFGEIFGSSTLWILYLYAFLMILMAMGICYVTGETLNFGEDIS